MEGGRVKRGASGWCRWWGGSSWIGRKKIGGGGQGNSAGGISKRIALELKAVGY